MLIIELTCDERVDTTGYYAAPDFTAGYIAELMNQNQEKRAVYLTYTFEYVLASAHTNFQKVKLVWLDIAGCELHPEMPGLLQTSFNYTTEPFTSSTLEGTIIRILGHVHDGGLGIKVARNEHLICDMQANYGRDPKYISRINNTTVEHISNFDWCDQNTRLLIGDSLSATAYYNTSLHTPIRMKDGNVQGVMGIILIYLIPD